MNQVIAAKTLGAVTESRDFYHVIRQSVSMRRHIEIFLWLNGELQKFLPHEILVVAWGDFASQKLHFDVISAIPGVRTQFFREDELAPLARNLHSAWIARGSSPFTIENEEGFWADASNLRPPLRALKSMRSAVIHGFQDARVNSSYLYFCLSSLCWDHPAAVRSTMEYVLPHLDVALRRLAPFLGESIPSGPISRLDAVSAPQQSVIPDLGLSAREKEVMHWVRNGKTNQEIGQILCISSFTVKNHLQRVYRKLDVLNRAQAVASISDDTHRYRAT